MDKLTFDLPYKVVPAVRMTQKSKFKDPAAQRYLTWKDGVQYRLKAIMAREGWEMLPGQMPLRVSIYIYEPSPHTHDLDNQIKAVLDAMNKIVYPDDRWVDSVTARRVQKKSINLFSIEVEVLDTRTRITGTRSSGMEGGDDGRIDGNPSKQDN